MSPDGERIIFNRQVVGQSVFEIVMADPDGTNEKVILSDGELNSFAQISPDGSLVVFDKWVGNDERNGEIFMLALEDGNLCRLTDNDSYDGYPTWFPDSRRIAYASNEGGEFRIFGINVDGTDRRQMSFGPGIEARPDISPDGITFLFNREIDGNIDIYVMAIAREAAEQSGSQ